MTFSHSNKELKCITNTLKVLMDDYSYIRYAFPIQAHSQYLLQEIQGVLNPRMFWVCYQQLLCYKTNKQTPPHQKTNT